LELAAHSRGGWGNSAALLLSKRGCESLRAPLRYGFTESFNLSVAAALVLQRLLDAMPESRGQLPPAEMDRLRREWYSGLARSDAARTEFARLADLGGAVPFCDARRPEVLRDERRRVVKPIVT
jgi:hypothetical protein